MRRFFLIAVLFTFSTILYSQEVKFSTGKYNKAEITLTSGKVIKCQKLIIDRTSINFIVPRKSLNSMDKKQSFPLDQVQQITAQTDDRRLEGAIVGLGAGMLAMVMVKSQYETPRAGQPDECDQLDWKWDECSYSAGQVTKKMAFAPKLYIVAAFTALGFLTGKSITEWEKVYPRENKKLSFQVSCYSQNLMLRTQLIF